MKSSVRYWLMALGAGLAAVAVLAACGDSGGGDSTSSASAETTASGGAEECVATAQKASDAALAPPKYKAPVNGFDMSVDEGKTIWAITLSTQNELHNGIAEDMKRIGAEYGIEVVVYDGKSDVNAQNQGISQAVAQGADAIILQSVATDIASGPIQEAAEAGIPVIDLWNGDPDQELGSLFAHVTSDFTADGARMADYVLANSNCEANTLVLGSASAYPLLESMKTGIETEYSELCPECGYEYIDINPAELATKGGPTAQNYLQAHPDTDWVIAEYDALAAIVVPGIQQMASGGQGVSVVSHDGVAQNLEYIRNGELQVMDMSFPPGEYVAYVLLDQAGRAMAGEAASNVVVPSRIVDKTNLPKSNDTTALFPGFGDYPTAFAELWEGK